MSSHRDPDSGSVDPTFVPAAPAGPDVTVAPSGDYSREFSGERTAPSIGTHASAGSNPTMFDETRAAPPLYAGASYTDADATRTAAGGAFGAGGPPVPAGVAVDRYVLRGFHAKGGLGEVHRAQDLELDREVAFKRMQGNFADDPGWREKFVAEARVTARLDHPGVVPVFGLVNDGHGRPCYAMRFIGGDTLRQKIDRFHGGGKTPAPPVPPLADAEARRVALRELLQRFIAVCQAVGFAHTRGVVHRDLKPANVMVGEFGETLVVDWGLAKTLGEPGTSDGAVAADPRAGTASLPVDPEERTEAGGKAVGTPAFMPPEQALGSPDAGPSADVFGLGAILFYTLTGKPPYSGADATATIQLAQRVEYPRPRVLAPTIPAALEAICLKAMAPAALDRYGSALDLAADVERWLSDEPVTAYRDPPAARAARWVRRHPARIAGGVSALFAGLVAAVAIGVVVQAARHRAEADNVALTDAQKKTAAALDDTKKANEKTTLALALVTAEEAKTREQKEAAVKAREVAEGRFGLAQGAFANVIGDVQAELDDRAGTQELRAAVLSKALAGLEKLAASAEGRLDRTEADRLRAWARLQMGEVRRTLGKTREAAADYEAAAVAAAALEKAGAPPEMKAGLADVHDRLADAFLALGDVRRATDEADRAQQLRPDTPAGDAALAGTLDRVAAVALEAGKTHPATAAADRALKIREGLAKDAPPGSAEARGLAAAYDRDAEVKLRVGDTAGAARSAAAAVGIRGKAAAEAGAAGTGRVSPPREWAAALAREAEVAAERADVSTEIKSREQAAALLAALAAKDAHNAGVRAEAAVARGRLGAARVRTGDVEVALAETDEACQLAAELAEFDTASPRAARAVGLTHWDRGDVRLKAGKAADAVADFAAAVTVFEKLQAADPGSARAARDAVEARERLAAARAATGEPAAAVAALTDAVEARRRAAEADPKSARAARDLAAAYGRLADAQLAAGSYAAAEDAAGAAAARFRARAEADPVNLAARRDLAAARSAWSRVTAARGEPTATLLLLQQARDGFTEVAAADPASAAAADEKAAALGRVADALGEADLPELRQEFEGEALAIHEALAAARPDSPYAQLGLVAAKRRLAETLTAARRFGDAEKQLTGAKAVLDRFPGSPVLAAEAKAVAEGAEVLAGVRAAAGNREAVKELPPAVRARVLTQLAEDHLRQNQPVTATWAAGLLGEYARGPDDLYRAAVVFARAASRTGAPPEYGTTAVELLGKAVDRGFRNPDLLRARWWDGLRDRDAFKAVEALLAAPKK